MKTIDLLFLSGLISATVVCGLSWLLWSNPAAVLTALGVLALIVGAWYWCALRLGGRADERAGRK